LILYCLIILITFDRVDFEKSISLSVKKKVKIESKWDVYKLSQLLNIVRGASPRPIRDYITNETDGVNWIKIGDVKPNSKFVFETSEKITEEGANKSRRVKKGDFILSNSMSFGRPYIMEIDGCIHDGWLLLSDFDESLNKDFLYYILSDKLVQNQFAHSASGGTSVDNLNIDKVSHTQIPLPPRDIQDKIVAEIKVLEIEETTLNDERDNLSLERNKIIDNASGSLIRLQDITKKIGSGSTPRGGESSYVESGINLIRSQNIYDNEFYETGLVFIDDDQAKKLNGVTVENNDILFNITGASVARCCIVNPAYLPARVNQHVAIIRANERALPKYIQQILVSTKYKSELLALAENSSTREAITKTQLEDFKIPLLSIDEQHNIVAKIESIESDLSRIEKDILTITKKKELVMKNYL